jgi:hypothetical protein
VEVFVGLLRGLPDLGVA